MRRLARCRPAGCFAPVYFPERSIGGLGLCRWQHLRVATQSLELCWRERHWASSDVGGAPPARGTQAHLHLCCRPRRCLIRAAEVALRERRDERVVFDARTGTPPVGISGLLEKRAGAALQLETHHLPSRLLVRRRVGGVAGSAPRHALLDPPHRQIRHASSHAFSVSGTATRLSSRAADQLRAPEASAPCISGNVTSARATRMRSWVVCTSHPAVAETYSTKLAKPSRPCASRRSQTTSHTASSASSAARRVAVRASSAWPRRQSGASAPPVARFQTWASIAPRIKSDTAHLQRDDSDRRVPVSRRPKSTEKLGHASRDWSSRYRYGDGMSSDDVTSMPIVYQVCRLYIWSLRARSSPSSRAFPPLALLSCVSVVRRDQSRPTWNRAAPFGGEQIARGRSQASRAERLPWRRAHRGRSVGSTAAFKGPRKRR